MRIGFSALGLLGAGLIVATGTSWAFIRGGQDFDVFYHAWSLARAGRLQEIYSDSPDRFLYAPGFAYWFAWISFIPRNWALGIFCLGKAAVVGLMIRSLLPKRDVRERLALAFSAAFGVWLIARPLLIEFQYGQLNLFVVAAAFWALRTHIQSGNDRSGHFAAWLVFSVLALSKPMAAPLLCVPFVMRAASPEKTRYERIGVLAGGLLLVAGVLFHLGWSGTWEIHAQWIAALRSKSIPLESHNQSVLAVLHHWLAGVPIRSLALGSQSFELFSGGAGVGLPMIHSIGLGLMLVFGGCLLAWMFNPYGHGGLAWVAGLVALTILPSHLIWKPYFVFGLPAAMLMTIQLSEKPTKRRRLMVISAISFLVMNFTTIDVVGNQAGAWVEASGLLLLIYLVLVGTSVLSESATKAFAPR